MADVNDNDNGNELGWREDVSFFSLCILPSVKQIGHAADSCCFGPREGGQSASPASEGKGFDINAWKMHVHVIDSRHLMKT